MIDIMTSQNIDLSSWDTLYSLGYGHRRKLNHRKWALLLPTLSWSPKPTLNTTRWPFLQCCNHLP
jgi:hypothetical protein